MDAVSASKVRLAKQLGVSRSSLYYHPKLPEKDLLLKEQIETVWKEYPSYGHKRLALELGVNKKRILRVMHQFQIKPYRRRVKPPVKKQDSHPEFAVCYPNLVQGLCPRVPHAVWVADFTYIRWRSGFIYLATVMDLFTREVLGWHVANHHQAYLVITAFTEAVEQAGTAPQILHSDQGSEYTCFSYGAQVLVAGTKLSYSKKSSPWQNGYQESFYSQFKLDLGDPQRFETLGELIAEIHTGIHRYNKLRIHTALKMPPSVFAERFHAQREKQRVCEKMGT